MSNNSKKIVTRFAPSPTGFLHVGTARSALYNYLFARQNNGKFILRIEDTDKERSKKEFEEDILESLKWLGFDYDELYRQSERGEIYKKYLQQLIDGEYAYVSKEDLSNPRVGIGGVVEREARGSAAVLRDEVIRFKNPNKKITFNDIILGDIEFDTTELGDFVIAKDMETPLYNFTVVVDDFDMGVTHIIRGQDHISNTPRQILMGEALGAPRPLYAHIPLILAPDKSKLSKRHGAVSVLEYKDRGYLPEAMANFLALIGWNPGGEEEIFSVQELIKEFSLEKVQKGGGVFNIEKLDWINKEHIKHLPKQVLEQLIEESIPDDVKKLKGYGKEMLLKIIPIITERIAKFSDIKEMAEAGELEYFFGQPEYEPEGLVWKKSNKEDTKKRLEKLQTLLHKIDKDQFTEIVVKEAVWDYAEKEGRGDVLWPMRFALSGRDKSPDPFVLAEVLGEEETLKRLKIAADILT